VWLQAINGASIEQQLLMRVARRGTAGLTGRGLMAETGLAREALHRLMEPEMSLNQLVPIPGDLLVTSGTLAAAIENIASRLKAGGTKMDVRRAELRTQTGLSKELFDFAIEKLAREQRLRLNGELVCPIESDPKSTLQDRTALAAIADAYQAAGLAAPQAAEVASKLNLADAEMRRLMTLLLRDRTLVRMGAGALYIHQNALAQLRVQVSLLRGQTLDVAGFKQLTGLSRKYAIPLLEYLDRERVTRKDGDRRLVL
jgi:selenocysteine-specific elongation factor